MSKVKELVEGALENIAEEEIVANSLYNITDFPIGGITNAQMVAALSVEQSGFYKENSVYLCVDNNGTYLKNHLYRFAGSSWVDATPSGVIIFQAQEEQAVEDTFAPKLTNENVVDIFNSVIEGNVVLVENMDSNQMFIVSNVNEVEDSENVSIYLNFKNKYILEYTDNENEDTDPATLNYNKINFENVITLTGDSGTLTDAQMKKVLNSNCIIVNGGEVYHFIESTQTYKAFMNINSPLITQIAYKIIYVNISSEAVNYGAWTKENPNPAISGEIYDIGSQQATLADGKYYPKMTVAQAKAIKDKFKVPNLFKIKWTLSGIEFYFEPFNFVDTPNGFMVNIHGKNIKFEWQSSAQDSDLITPVFVNGGKYEHTINVVNGTTPYGTWNYQFKFLDDDNTPYTSLADVGTHLYDTYGNAKIDASGTYIDSNSQTYLIISVRGTSNNMVEIEYVKLSDGIVSTTTSGLLAVVDSVH